MENVSCTFHNLIRKTFCALCKPCKPPQVVSAEPTSCKCCQTMCGKETERQKIRRLMASSSMNPSAQAQCDPAASSSSYQPTASLSCSSAVTPWCPPHVSAHCSIALPSVKAFARKYGKVPQMSCPRGIAACEDKAFVAEQEAGVVTVISNPGMEQLRVIKQKDQISRPTDVAVFDSELFVCDSALNSVSVFTLCGGFKRRLGVGELKAPQGLAICPYGYLFVADTESDRILKFTRAGELKGVIGSSGKGPGQLSQPHSVILIGRELYVTEYYGHRVSVFDAINGRFLRTWASKGSGPGDLCFPNGISAVGSNAVVVADKANHRLQLFDRSGNYLDQVDTDQLPTGVRTVYNTAAVRGAILRHKLPHELFVCDALLNIVLEYVVEVQVVASVGGYVTCNKSHCLQVYNMILSDPVDSASSSSKMADSSSSVATRFQRGCF